jgi:V8-like Glu-specific endopeptidase
MKFVGRFFILSLVAITLSRAVFAVTPSPATARLTIDDSTCSGTVVAPTVILSAAHCFKEPEDEFGSIMLLPPKPLPTTMLVDGYKVYIQAIVFDGNDHALVKVSFFFKDYALLAKMPGVGAHVYYWGNPDGIRNVYREGYVTSYDHSEMVMDVNGFFGDSGAGIFDESGKLIGVMSYINVHRHQGTSFRLMGAYPLEFTPLQYSMMGVTPP